MHYLTGWPDEAALARILTDLCARQGIPTDPLPEGLRQRTTTTHRFMFNYNAVAVEWGDVTIPAAGVYWTKT
jgi:beta-galactosidase